MKVQFSKEDLGNIETALMCAAYQSARDCRLIGSPSLKKALTDEAQRYENLRRKIRKTMESQS